MSRVWIVNFAGHDYSDAERFGELDYITRGYISLGHLDRILYTVSESVAKTDESDWLLPSGLILLNALTAAVWLKKHGTLNLLVWDQKTNCYRPMTISSPQIDGLLGELGDDEGRDETTQRGGVVG